MAGRSMKLGALRCVVSALSGILAVTVFSAPSAMPILDYIKETWITLTRSNRDLASAAADAKSHPLPDGRWPVYVGRDENISRLEGALRERNHLQDLRRIDLRPLPTDLTKIPIQGLLYLPHPYVVPGEPF